MLQAPRGQPPPSQVGERTIGEMIDCARARPPGAFLEVGVFKGGTAWHLAKLGAEQQRELYLFDTFTGIPYSSPIDSHKVGDFSDVDLPGLRAALPGAHILAGIFPEVAWLLGLDLPPIAFAHIDCDQYQSVRSAAEFLTPCMVKGGVMWFDDSPCLKGAELATKELFGSRLLVSETTKHYVEF
jgi:Macrocin-O-methyltransferase (TylF)